MITTTDFEILPELRDCLPASTADERKRLKESIERDGMLYGILLCTIKGMPGRYILDGHTRDEIAREIGMASTIHADDMLHFDSIDDAVCWIIEHQVARRNLTTEQEAVVMKRYYEAKKKPLGGAEYRAGSVCKNYTPISTAEEVGREYGVSAKTVHNAVNKAKKFDDLGLTDAVMSGEIKSIPNPVLKDILEAVEADPERKEKIVAEVIETARQNNGRVKATKKPKQQSKPEPEQELIAEEIDDELEESFELVRERTENTIFRFRTEWPESYLRRLRKVIDNAFVCEIPQEWLES